MGQTDSNLSEAQHQKKKQNNCSMCGILEDITAKPVTPRRKCLEADTEALLPKTNAFVSSKQLSATLRSQLRDRPPAEDRWAQAKAEWERGVLAEVEQAASNKEPSPEADDRDASRLQAMQLIREEDEARKKAEAAAAATSDAGCADAQEGLSPPRPAGLGEEPVLPLSPDKPSTLEPDNPACADSAPARQQDSR
eukprot:gnl/TRDRNA2_/TRDRNA2_191238_c0_seq1.p1 gnl/TRDRNA2_/TRDRNA2_191238_c0~~gnl/TRDRNA2_/TRDRNA2_191238_c0_seq1.p1  ORF type:complete len:195 (+),score=44.57 gnl/TRDRNA2_/TRDRNA2_191238_c0_seq1:102-686(+)